MQKIRLKDNRTSGEERPWGEYKKQSLALAASYLRIAAKTKDEQLKKRGGRVHYCGNDLEFSQVVNTTTGEQKRKLTAANFCRDRLCPMCAARKSLKLYAELKTTVDELIKRNSNCEFLFLTLTVKNCNGDELPAMIDRLQNGFRKLRKHLERNQTILGTYRALEISVNPETGEYHPHFHCIVVVDRKTYFEGEKFLTTKEWASLWAKYAGLDYNPVCDVRKIKGDLSKAVAEVAKYALKPGAWLSNDQSKTDAAVYTLSNALFNRRLVAFSGVLAAVRREIKLDNENLVNTGSDELKTDDTVLLIEHYSWSKNDYLLTQTRKPISEGKQLVTQYSPPPDYMVA